MIRPLGVISLLTVASIVGCSKSETSTGAATQSSSAKHAPKSADAKIAIAVIPKATADVFWQSVHAGATKAAGELGNVEVRWQGPPVEGERAQQIGMVDDMVSNGVDAICLAPADSNALVDTINSVATKMPIVLFDSGAKTDTYSAFVATDNFEGGKLAGKRMLELLPDGGDIAIVRVLAGSQSTTQREEGFKSIIATNPKIHIVSEQYGQADKGKSQQVADDTLASHPDLKGFYGPNESTTFGILGALNDNHKKPGEVKFVGFDSNNDLVHGLETGMIDSLVVQDPVQMGYLAVKAANAAVRGQTVVKEQPIPPTLITHDSMNDPKNTALLHPKLD